MIACLVRLFSSVRVYSWKNSVLHSWHTGRLRTSITVGHRILNEIQCSEDGTQFSFSVYSYRIVSVQLLYSSKETLHQNCKHAHLTANNINRNCTCIRAENRCLFWLQVSYFLTMVVMLWGQYYFKNRVHLICLDFEIFG